MWLWTLSMCGTVAQAALRSSVISQSWGSRASTGGMSWVVVVGCRLQVNSTLFTERSIAWVWFDVCISSESFIVFPHHPSHTRRPHEVSGFQIFLGTFEVRLAHLEGGIYVTMIMKIKILMKLVGWCWFDRYIFELGDTNILVTQENKNSILDIISRPQWWKTTIIFCKCYVHVLYSLCFCLSRKVIISLYLR